jgi:hypothetical protein
LEDRILFLEDTMAQFDTQKLDRLDPFPPMTLSLTDGTTIDLPDAFAESWWIFIVYRAHW